VLGSAHGIAARPWERPCSPEGGMVGSTLVQALARRSSVGPATLEGLGRSTQVVVLKEADSWSGNGMVSRGDGQCNRMVSGMCND